MANTIIFAAPSRKSHIIMSQLSLVCGVKKEQISALDTLYTGITLLSVGENHSPSLRSLRHVEVLLLDEAAAKYLLEREIASKNRLFESLERVDEREQYDHLSQLLHIHKAKKEIEDEILRN